LPQQVKTQTVKSKKSCIEFTQENLIEFSL